MENRVLRRRDWHVWRELQVEKALNIMNVASQSHNIDEDFVRQRQMDWWYEWLGLFRASERQTGRGQQSRWTGTCGRRYQRNTGSHY